MITLPSYVNTALTALQNAGYEAYIVGGCVRDSLMNRLPHDYDITTSAQPTEIKSVFKEYRTIDTAIVHGTVTVLIDDTPIEITTFRTETTYSDNRHPDKVIFSRSLSDDLSRRDFTMNAVCFNMDSGVTDLFGGKSDIDNKIIRCVGNADKRFKEDALRILRAIRFASVLDFEIASDTEQAIFDNKDLLLNISSERIFSELKTLLKGKAVKKILTGYVDVLGVVIPELLPMKDFDQKNPHHIYDVLTHTAVVVENTPAEDALRLAALLHDIGKPDSFSIDKKGIGHFHGHHEISVELASEILVRLRVDNDTKEQVLTLIKWHDYPIMPTEQDVKKLMSRIGARLFFMLLDLKRADNSGQNIAKYNHLDEISTLEAIGKRVMNEKQCFTLKSLNIDGNDLKELGLTGKEIGNMLSTLLHAVIDGRVVNSRAPLMSYARSKIK